MATFTERLALLISAQDAGATRALTKISGAAKTAGKEADETQKKYKQLSAGLRVGIGVAASVAAYKLAQFTGDAIKAASDLAETQNKVNVVFGESADVITKMGETSADALGLSKNAAEGAAAAFGNMFKTTGLAEDEAAKMSVTMVGLASDMASFNNEDPSDMLDRLRSGLAGEAEPLRRFGVLLSAARVEQEAMRLGLADANGELSESAKVQARYSLILKDTAVQQGDFARTSDGLANQQRILAAQFENAKAELGQGLLPVMTDLAEVANKVLGGFNDLDPTVQKIVLGVGALTTASVLLLPRLLAINAGLKDMGISASGAAGKLGVLGFAVTEAAQGFNYAKDLLKIWGDETKSFGEKNLASLQSFLRATSFGMIDLGDSSTEAKGSLNDLYTIGLQVARGLVSETNPAVAALGEEVVDTTGKLKLLNGEMLSVTETDIAFRDALADWTEQVRDATKSEDKFAHSLSKQNQTGRDNISALTGMAEAAAAHAQAVFEQTGSLDKANSALRSDRKHLLDAAEAAGFNRKKVADLIDEYLKVPKNVKTKVKAEVSGLSQLQTLSNIITTLNGVRVNIPVSAITARQHGGPVSPNKPYLVGEKRAEILYNNRIYPGGRAPSALTPAAANGGGLVIQSANFYGVQDVAGMVRSLEKYAKDHGGIKLRIRT